MKPAWHSRAAFVAGISTTKWGFYPDLECHDYAGDAVRGALSDAGMQWSDVQAVFSGSVYQGTGSGHRVIKEVGRTGIPIVNVENACSSSASAFRLAFQQVATGIYDVVLVLGMEKNPRGPIASTAFRAWELELGFNFHPGNYAIQASKYMAQTGASEEDISLVTVKNRQNAALNPNARFQVPVTLEEVLGSRMVAPPLRLLHCCPLADGASASIICSADRLRSPDRAVTIMTSILTSGVHGEEYLPGGMVGSIKFPPEANLVELSAHQAYEAAGLGPEDIDVVQLYDTVAPSELWELEELGFCGRGEASRSLREGAFHLDGRLPVNTDGGLMGRGHAMGATGLAQVAELVMQLRGEAGRRQVSNSMTGLAHAMGAGPNSAVTILAR